MGAVISVIVPAYNVAPYIDCCLASLFSQTVPLEIIVIDDGSTDATAERIRAVQPPERHSIVLIDQQNQGLSSARNAGVARATAEFIAFVDGDDWVDPDMYATMTSAAGRADAEITISTGQMVDHHTQAPKPFQDDRRFHDLAQRYPDSFDPRDVPDVFVLDTSVCRRLFKRALFIRTGFRFPEGLLFEDVLAHYVLLTASRKILLVDRLFYHYRINHPGRITDRKGKDLLTIFEVMRACQARLRSVHATDDIWAGFIWFQHWALRWLGSQIDPAYSSEFSREVLTIARRCPRQGVAAFQRRFASDDDAQQAVALQMFGMGSTFMHLATGRLDAADRRRLEIARRFRRFAPYFAGG